MENLRSYLRSDGRECLELPEKLDDTAYKTIIFVFDPVFIYKNPDYKLVPDFDTRAVMKTLISGIEKNIRRLKRISTPAPHIFFCLQRVHAVVGIQTNILQNIMMFLSFDVVWMSDIDDENDNRRIILVNPFREKITILNPDAEQKYRTVVSRNFEHMKNLVISRTIEIDRKLKEDQNRLNPDTCCLVQ